jgi:hypothetical protein
MKKNIDSEPWYLNQAGPFSKEMGCWLQPCSNLPAWVRNPFLLQEFWNEETFAGIVNDLGKIAKFLDLNTHNKMSTCAKICIEMDNSSSGYTQLPMGARGVSYENVQFQSYVML